MIADSQSSPGSQRHRSYLVAAIQGLLTIVFIAAIVWYLSVHRAEISSVVEAFRRGNWSWLLLAVVAESYYFYLAAGYFQRTLALVSIRVSRFITVLTILGAQSVGVVTPTEFLAVQGLFVNQAIVRDQSRSRTVIGVFLAQVAELYAFCLLLVVGLLFLIFQQGISRVEIVSFIVLLLLVLVTVLILAVIAYRPGFLKTLLTWANRFLGLFSRSNHIVSDEQIESLNHGLLDSSEAIRSNPTRLYQALGLALLAHLVRVLCLWLTAQAFSLTVAPWQAVVAYCFGTLTWIISPVPQGIGLVEGAYTVALVKLGLPVASAATLALAYRGVIFWLPFLLGLPALRYLRSWESVDKTRVKS